MRYLCQLLIALAICGATVAYAGDGYDVFFDGSGHVYNIFHHNNEGGNPAIDCHDRGGQGCGPGWPFYFNDPSKTASPFWSTGFTPTGWVDDANKRIWFQTSTSSATGFACIDISNLASPTYCFGSKAAAFKELGSNPNSPSPATWSPDGVNTQANVGSKLYVFESATGKLLCMDASQATSTNSGACTNQPFQPVSTSTLYTQYAGDSPGVGGWAAQLAAVGGKLYGFIGNSPSTRTSVYGICWDVASDSACSGWPISISSSTTNMYELPDNQGNLLGMCFTNTVEGGGSQTSQCYDSGGTSVADSSGIAPRLAAVYQKSFYSSTREYYQGWVNRPQRIGTRIYWVDGMWYHYNGGAWAKPSTNIQCYDVFTQSNCISSSVASWPFSWPQTNSLTATGSGTTYWNESDWAYTDVTYAIKVDPRPGGFTCLWKNGDNTLIASYDSESAVPFGWFLGRNSVNVPVNICMDPNPSTGYFTTTNTVVTSSSNPSVAGQTVTFTATVTGVQTKDSSGNVVATRTPDGPIDGGVMIWVTPEGGTPFLACAAAPFSSTSPTNVVTCDYTFSTNGVYSVLAIYGGSVNFGPSNDTEQQYVGVKRPVTVTAESTSITYGTAVPAIGFTTDPAVTGEDWDTAPTCAVYASSDTSYTTPLTGILSPGTYVTHCSGGSSSKYNPTDYFNGTLVVNPPPTQAQLTDTSATCTSVFLRSGYPSLSSISYSVKGTKINQVNPGVFFYWAKIVLNSNGTVLTQSQLPFWGQYLSQASGSLLYDLSCNTVKKTSVSTTGGVTSVRGATAGTYYLAVKFSANDLSGITPSSFSPMTATFTSSRGAATVSLQIVRKDTGKP